MERELAQARYGGGRGLVLPQQRQTLLTSQGRPSPLCGVVCGYRKVGGKKGDWEWYIKK